MELYHVHVFRVDSAGCFENENESPTCIVINGIPADVRSLVGLIRDRWKEPQFLGLKVLLILLMVIAPPDSIGPLSRKMDREHNDSCSSCCMPAFGLFAQSRQPR